MGSLSRTHIQSPSALSQLQLCIIFFQYFIEEIFFNSNILYVFFHNFPITLNMVRTSNTFIPGSGYPEYYLCAMKQETKTTGRVHRAGDNRIGTRQKTQMCRFTQKPSTHLPSLEQEEATVQFLHLSLRFPGPPKQEPVLLLEPRVLKNESWNSEMLPLELCGDLVEIMKQQTYTVRQSNSCYKKTNLQIYFFVTFLNRENKILLGER